MNAKIRLEAELAALKAENQQLHSELEKRRGTQQRLEAVLDCLPSMVGYWDRDRRNRYCNQAYVAWFGISPEDAYGRHMREVIGEERYRLNLPYIEKALQGEPQRFERAIPSPDGQRIRHSLAEYIPDISDGDVRGLFVLVSDVTPLKEAEASLRAQEAQLHELALRNSKERLRALFEQAAIGIAEVGRDGRWLRVNAKLCEITGYREEELLATDFQSITHPDDLSFDMELAGRLERGEIPSYSMEKRYVRPDGSLVWVNLTGAVVRDTQGHPAYYVAVIEDISERKQAEGALHIAKADAERANKAKSRFLAAASHDLRQPLSAISLYADGLLARVPPGDQPLVENLKECLGNLNELLTDLLDLSKLEAGVVKPNITEFPIDELLTSLISVHAPEAAIKGLDLRCVASTLIVRSDPLLVRRMLGNFIANAVRYTEQGSVLVGCRRKADKVWIEVWDTGVGIPDDQIDAVFEEFKQIAEARQRGSGLGLAIVAKMGALLDLPIRVRSWVGKGSVFAVELPLGVGAEMSPATEQVKPAQLRIALCDDNRHVLKALEFSLSAFGHEVVAAATGQALTTRLGDGTPDIIISDYRLSEDENGFDVINRVRRIFAEELPAILITGDTDPQLLRSMSARGVLVLHKPLQIDELQACVARLVPSGAGEAPAERPH